MTRLRIGLLSKKRGNFALQAKFAGETQVADETGAEVAHHEQALLEAGYEVCKIRWGPTFIQDVQRAQVDLVFNVSSLVEAAILEEFKVPFVGSNSFGIVIATDKSLAKKLWQHQGLPTSPFVVARNVQDCEPFQGSSADYPLFIKPVAGRGSAGINDASVVYNYEQLIGGVRERLDKIGQPVLIEHFLRGREITLGVIGNGENARVLPPLEICYKEGDVTLTFEKKELDDDSFLCPAPLDQDQHATMRQLALRAYRVLELQDFARFDTILTDQGPMLLEANSFAGLMCTPPEKPHSYIGFMARAENKGGKELLDEIIQVAAKRLGLES